MPTSNKFEWEDFKVKTEPVGIRKVFRLLPYFTGNKLKFKVSINTTSGKQHELDAYLNSTDPSSHELTLSTIILAVPKTPVNKIVKKVESRSPVGISGDPRIEIELHCGKMYYSQDLVTFRAIAHEIMWGWTIGTIIGISLLVVGIWHLVLLIT